MVPNENDRKKVNDLQKAMETVSQPSSHLANRTKREFPDNQTAAHRPREAGGPPHPRRGRDPQHRRGGYRRQIRRELPNLPLCPRGHRDSTGRSPKPVHAPKERPRVCCKGSVSLSSPFIDQPSSIESPFMTLFPLSIAPRRAFLISHSLLFLQSHSQARLHSALSSSSTRKVALKSQMSQTLLSLKSVSDLPPAYQVS